MKHINIASIQPPFSVDKSTKANKAIINKGFDLLEKALKTGTDFCCLPEFFNVFGLELEDMKIECANSDSIIEKSRKLAKQYKSYIIIPLYLKEKNHFFNRAYLINPKGEISGHYDKLYPTLGEKTNLNIMPGKKLNIFETEFGRVAVIICYDIYFPELSVLLSEMKADIVFFPSLQRSEHEMASEAFLKVRAMDTQAYLVRSCYGAPAESSWRPSMMFGQSAIVHPDGTILANAGHYEGIAFAAHMQMPFTWKRPRCGGMPAMPVREFINEDRKKRI
jgi:predicted amidohydrolase